MIYIGYFILFFTVLQLLVAASNLVFLQRFPKNDKQLNYTVSVLIPARNEEKNIGNLLGDLQKQDYQNIEILVYNDQSTDETEALIKKSAEKDQRIRMIPSIVLPEGWLGKNNACHNLAQHAKGKYLLFLDADVHVGNSILQNSVSFAEKHKLGLLSIFPLQIMQTLGEQATVPNMNYILLSLLPLVLVRQTNFPSIAAANGQFMLFDAEIYRRTLPHRQMKSSKVEDIKIARFYKHNKIKVACLTGKPSISCRMYHGFREAVYGFSKNVIQFFGASFLLAILFWLITTFGFIAVLLSFSKTVILLYFSALIATRIFISIVSKQAVLRNLVLAIPQQISLGLFIAQAMANVIKNQYTWKDRNISG